MKETSGDSITPGAPTRSRRARRRSRGVAICEDLCVWRMSLLCVVAMAVSVFLAFTFADRAGVERVSA